MAKPVFVIGNSLASGLEDERWEVDSHPGATLEQLWGVMQVRLRMGNVVLAIVGTTDIQDGRGGVWLRKRLEEGMEEYEGFVPCTFWPPVGAPTPLVQEVVATNHVIREGNARRGYGTPHLEKGIFRWMGEKRGYEVDGRRLEDGLHPTEEEKGKMRERLGWWFEVAKRDGVVKMRASGVRRDDLRERLQERRTERGWRATDGESSGSDGRWDEERSERALVRVREIEEEMRELEERRRVLEEERKEQLAIWAGGNEGRCQAESMERRRWRERGEEREREEMWRGERRERREEERGEEVEIRRPGRLILRIGELQQEEAERTRRGREGRMRRREG